MPQSQFVLQQGCSKELELFPHISEFGLRRTNTIQLNSFEISVCHSLRTYFIIDGKFEWSINNQCHVLYPGDLAVVLPGQEIGGSTGYWGIGAVFWLDLELGKKAKDRKIALGKWSNLTDSEHLAIEKILLLNDLPVLKVKEAFTFFQEMRSEIVGQELGFVTRVNQILDLLLIMVARQATRQANSRRDFPQAFTKLEQTLRQNLAHQWTVDEMAAMVGLGTTAFTEKVKNYTGFAPLHYLINIRISESIKLLKRSGVSVTDIAFETGFYSSQHFSTTFKKLTGYTPGGFRKRNMTNL